jgi:hypothetical protein
VRILGNEKGGKKKQDNVGQTIRTPPFSERKLAAGLRREVEMALLD